MAATLSDLDTALAAQDASLTDLGSAVGRIDADLTAALAKIAGGASTADVTAELQKVQANTAKLVAAIGSINTTDPAPAVTPPVTTPPAAGA